MEKALINRYVLHLSPETFVFHTDNNSGILKILEGGLIKAKNKLSELKQGPQEQLAKCMSAYRHVGESILKYFLEEIFKGRREKLPTKVYCTQIIKGDSSEITDLLAWHGDSGDFYMAQINKEGTKKHYEFHEFKTVKQALQKKHEKTKEIIQSYL